MRMISRIDELKTFAQSTTGAVSFYQGYLGSLGAVGCFALIAVISIPLPIALGRLLLLFLALACIGGIAIASKWHGLLTGVEAEINSRVTS